MNDVCITKACTPTSSRLFPVPPGREVGMDVQTIGIISQERLKIEVKLLLSANRKSYMPRLLAQQRMTLSDLEWPFYAPRAISAVGELLVCEPSNRFCGFLFCAHAQSENYS